MHDKHLIKIKMEDALEALIDYRGKTPKKSSCGISTLSAKSVKNGFIDYSQCYFISRDEYKKFMVRGFPQKGDILLTTEAPLGVVAKLDRNDVAVAQRLLTLRGKKGLLDNDYLLYYLQSSAGQGALKARESGTTVTGIKQAEFRKIELVLPSIDTQKRIASILSSLDDKIKNSTQINHNLEEQAKAIFKSWFVDLEPFSRIIPKTWKEGVLGNFVEIKRGASPRPIQDFISSKGFRWLKISDATACDSPFLIEIKEHIKESGLSKTVFLQAGALVLSNSATPGIPKILDVDSCIHDGWLYFPKSQLSKEFLFLFFQNIRPKLVLLGNGSVFTNLKTDILKTLPFSLPDKETLANFDRVILPIFERIKNNSRESYRLAQMRDTLLPKLMSGEIDMSDVSG